jgi:hypothetical protein
VVANYADLQVQNIAVLPASPQSGNALTITWDDANTGNQASGPYRDFIVVRNNKTDQQLVSVPLDVLSVGAGGSHQRSYSFTLPDGNAGAGELAITITADSSNSVFEFNPAGTGETNNTTTASVTSTLAHYADLVVTALVAPTTALSSNPAILDVDLTVHNQGDGDATGSWSDAIYISTDGVVGNADDRLVDTFSGSGPLAAGASYTRKLHLTLPQNLDGTRYLYALTDASSNVKEFTNGVAADNNNTGAAVPILLRPLHADLAVQAVTAPAAAQSGDPIDVSWRVGNAGKIFTTPNTWTDSVYLSADNVLDVNIDTLLGSFTQISTLQPEASYTARRSVTLPNGIAGSFYVFVLADSGTVLFESTDEANNTGRSVEAVAVTLKPFPDLHVTTVSGPASGQAGQTASVTWTVSNGGTGDAQGTWTDNIYLSPDGTLSGASFLGQVSHTGLASHGSYTVTQNVTLPSVADGSYRFVVLTDASTSTPPRATTSPRRPGRSPSRIRT